MYEKKNMRPWAHGVRCSYKPDSVLPAGQYVSHTIPR